MRSLKLGAALLAVAALLVTGCTPTTEPPRTSPTDAPASAAPSPSPTVEPDAAPASLAFDGDCSLAISDADLADLLGPDAHLWVEDDRTARWTFTQAAALAAGTTTCLWATDVGGDFVEAIMSPLETAEEDLVATAEPAACGVDAWGGQTCSVGVVVGDSWLTVRARSEDALTRAVAVLGSTLVAEKPEPAEIPADAWALPDCVALGTAVHGAVSEAPAPEPGSGAFAEQLRAFGSMTSCAFPAVDGVTQPARVFVFAGVGDDSFTTDLPEIDVAGADVAYGADRGEQLAIIGSNAVVVTAADAEAARAILAAVIPVPSGRPAPNDDEEDEG